MGSKGQKGPDHTLSGPVGDSGQCWGGGRLGRWSFIDGPLGREEREGNAGKVGVGWGGVVAARFKKKDLGSHSGLWSKLLEQASGQVIRGRAKRGGRWRGGA